MPVFMTVHIHTVQIYILLEKHLKGYLKSIFRNRADVKTFSVRPSSCLYCLIKKKKKKNIHIKDLRKRTLENKHNLQISVTVWM